MTTAELRAAINAAAESGGGVVTLSPGTTIVFTDGEDGVDFRGMALRFH